MTRTRKVGIVVAAVIALFVAGNIYYFMPRATKALITGIDVKRVDRNQVTTSGAKTRDVRYIYATNLETDHAMVFRNEDNAWYLKFDSGDIAAEASRLASNKVDEVALVKYYGLRIAILDSYPNVLSIKQVEEDYVYVPWVNMIILVVLLVVFVWAGVKVRKLIRAAKDKLSKRPAAS